MTGIAAWSGADEPDGICKAGGFCYE